MGYIGFKTHLLAILGHPSMAFQNSNIFWETNLWKHGLEIAHVLCRYSGTSFKKQQAQTQSKSTLPNSSPLKSNGWEGLPCKILGPREGTPTLIRLYQGIMEGSLTIFCTPGLFCWTSFAVLSRGIGGQTIQNCPCIFAHQQFFHRLKEWHWMTPVSNHILDGFPL